MFRFLFRFRQCLVIALSCVLFLVMVPSLSVLAKSSSGDLPHAPLTERTSLNWSGYVAQGSSDLPATYSDVVGSWVVPSASCSQGETSAASSWVGIGGAAGITNLEQIGAETGCLQGQAIYSAWYEMYPAAPLVIISFNIGPGDSVQAEVAYVNQGIFVLTLRDATRGWRFAVSKPGPISAGDRGTAEWITEAPKERGSTAQLTNFSSVYFYNCFANGQSISNSPTPEEDIMTTDGSAQGITKARPSGLASSGTAFSVTWYLVN